MSRLQNGTRISLRCVRACKGSSAVTLRKTGKRKRLSLKLRTRIWVTRKTIVEVRATRVGRRGRWATYKFKRAGNVLLAVRIDQGCLASGSQPRRARCAG